MVIVLNKKIRWMFRYRINTARGEIAQLLTRKDGYQFNWANTQ